jgi:hypothetical protein
MTFNKCEHDFLEYMRGITASTWNAFWGTEEGRIHFYVPMVVDNLLDEYQTRKNATRETPP